MLSNKAHKKAVSDNNKTLFAQIHQVRAWARQLLKSLV